MKIIQEVRFHYVLMEDADEWYLTFMSGGPVEIDFCVKLNSDEVRRIKNNSQAVESIISDLKADTDTLMQRRVVPSIWPSR
jgi:hypothetical protein